MYRAIEPSTGEVLSEQPFDDSAVVESRLRAGSDAFRSWRERPVKWRAVEVARWAGALRARRESLAELAAREMGKPVSEGLAEVDKCAWACEHYAARAADALAPVHVATDARRSYVRRDPVGLLLAIMPWNFPFWQVVRCAAPALMAGNTVLLKHAPNVPGCAAAIVQTARDAGLDVGVFDRVSISDTTTLSLVGDDRVAAVSLTGSVRAGRAVGAAAGGALKPCVLELGGSDPCVVLDDCDLDTAVAGALLSRMLNAGQSCIAAKRIIVAENVHDAFVQRFVTAAAALHVGDPRNLDTRMGPLAREDLRVALHAQVERAVAAGASVALGGALPEGPGWFYPPTVLIDVGTDTAVFCEETFGPVAAVVRAQDAEDAFGLAAQTEFGLGAAVWTRDTERAEQWAARAGVGSVAINGIVKSDPRLPFGGCRASGVGRELGDEGLYAFAPPKSVWIGSS